MKRKRLIFFAGVYDTLDLFTYELNRAFEDLKYETMFFDVTKMADSLEQLSRFVQEPVEAVITFNNLGFNMELNQGKNLWEELKIPCINILMDHPFCYHNALQAAPGNAVVLCTDRKHMDYVKRFYPNIAVTGFLPHAGKECGHIKREIRKRSVDVLYAGNLSRAFADNIKPDFSKYTEFDARKACEEAYQYLILNPDRTTEQALEVALHAIGYSCDDQKLAEIIADLHIVDLYAVSYYREKTVAALAESGIQIALYGAGWDTCPWVRLPNVYYYGKVAAEKIVEKMQDAKVALNTMTWFKDGTHDRILNGMLQGAVVVSDTSIYMEEEFSGFLSQEGCDERELILFQLQEISKLPEQVNRLLLDDALAQGIADRGYKKAKLGHMWAHRAMELKEGILDNRELMEYLHG